MALAPNDVGNGGYDAGIRLVAAHRSGDLAAFDEIVRTHYPTLLACARRRLRNSEDAQDAVQETLLRAYRGLDRFGRSGDWRLGAWLHTILLHVCADVPRRRHATVPLEDWLADAHVGALDEVAETTSDHVALAAVHQAIATLPDSQRRAFELRLVEGRTYEEVAGTLGITKTNARARVQRARTTLQHALKGAGAVSGTLATLPLFLTASARAAFRRVFSGAGDSARAATSQVLSAGAASGSQAAAAVTASPVGSSMQLIAQVSATPVAQAVVASATSIPKGSVVLGIVASLATAGGVGPALISGTTTASRTAGPPAHVVRALETPATTTAAPAGTASTTPGHGASSAPSSASSTTSGTPSSTSIPSAPAWVTLAAISTTYHQPAPTTSGASGTSTSGSASSTSTSSNTGGTSSAGTTTSSTTNGSSTTSGATTTPTTPPTAGTAHTFPLPAGTCSGVAGFSGVTTPTSLPPLSSSVLDAILSTGAVSLTTHTGSPAFGGTAVVKATVGSTAPVHVKVGTCLAEGGSLLAVDMTGTTGAEVQLVGSLVSAPLSVTPTASSPSSDVAYLFRGNVTQIAGTAGPGGGLPWGLPTSFVAEVQVQQPSETGTLTVVFLQPMNQVGVNEVTIGTAAPPAGSTPGTTTGSTTGTGTGSTAGTPSGTGQTTSTGGTGTTTTSSTGTTRQSEPAMTTTSGATTGSTSSSATPAS